MKGNYDDWDGVDWAGAADGSRLAAVDAAYKSAEGSSCEPEVGSRVVPTRADWSKFTLRTAEKLGLNLHE